VHTPAVEEDLGPGHKSQDLGPGHESQDLGPGHESQQQHHHNHQL